MNKTEAILIGLLYTDGCLSPKGKNSWRFYFSNTSLRLVEIFSECMRECFALPQARMRRDVTKDNLYRVIVDSKEWGTYLTTHYGTFRTLRYASSELPKARLPVRELLTKNVASAFLQAAFSCDGGVNLYVARRQGARGGTQWLIRGVYIACAHPQLRNDYCKILSALGIKARNVAGDGKVKIETEKDIRRFYEMVGFLPGVHITHTSKFWPRIEKQELLLKLIASYENPAKFYTLPSFVHVR